MRSLPRIHISDRGAAWILALLAFGLYLNTLGHGFVWDDKLVITSNPVTVKGWDGFWEIITTKSAVPNKNVYRPVPQLMFAAEYALSGGKPWLSHLMNALLYAALCAVVLRFLRRVFATAPTLLLLGIGLVYAAHPLHVEVVANIKSRDEILAMLLGLLGAMALQRGCAEGRWLPALVGLAYFGLALLSKTNAVTLLPVALLLHWYRLPGVWFDPGTWRLAGCLALLGGATTVSLLLTLLGAALLGAGCWQGAGSLSWKPLAWGLGLAGMAGLIWAEVSYTPSDGYAYLTEATQLNNVLIDATQAQLVRPTALANCGRYLGLFVYPHPLVHMYGYGQVPLVGLGHPLTLTALALVILGLSACLTGIPRREPVAFGIAFFLCTFSIYSNFWVTAPDTMADRYLFLPSLGLCVVLGFGLYALLAWVTQGSPERRAGMALLVLLPMAVAAGTATVLANRDWASDGTLIKNRIAYMENSAPAQAMLGFVLYQDARAATDPAERDRNYQQALFALHRALAIYPDFYVGWTESGKIFAEVGLYAKAEVCFLKAIQLSPRSPEAHGHLGTMLFFRDEARAALPYLENALSLNPTQEPLLHLLARAYLQTGRWEALLRVSEYGGRYFASNPAYLKLAAIARHQLGQPIL
jgi:hypothetical protein